MRTFCTYGEHTWEWLDEIDAYECSACHERILGNPQIEPCIRCGQDTDADSTLCGDCVNETYFSTLAELADAFGIPHSTLRQAAWDGRLKARKSGRTWLSTSQDVVEYLETRWQR